MSISTLCSPSLPPTPVIFSHPSCPFSTPPTTLFPLLSVQHALRRPCRLLLLLRSRTRGGSQPVHPTLSHLSHGSPSFSPSPFSTPEFHRFSTATKFAIDISEWHVYIEWPLARFARGWNARKEIGNRKRERVKKEKGKGKIVWKIFVIPFSANPYRRITSVSTDQPFQVPATSRAGNSAMAVILIRWTGRVNRGRVVRRE